jgi:hypothetical protein
MKILLLTIPLFSLLSEPKASPQDRTDVVVDQIHLMFNRKGSLLEVEQFIRLSGDSAKSGNNKKERYRIELPKGAWGLAPIGDEQPGIAIEERSVIIKGPIAKDGTEVSIRYYLPIEGGTVIFDQELGSSTTSVQAVSTWTIREAGMVGKWFGRAHTVELSSGIEALVASSQEIADGHIALTLTNLSDGPETVRRVVSLVLSVFLLALGLIFHLRQRIISGGNRAETKRADLG